MSLSGTDMGFPQNQRQVIRGAALPTHPRIYAQPYNKFPCGGNYMINYNNMNNNDISGRPG
jgi:hypothetical protein